jgi:hypothetical protein
VIKDRCFHYDPLSCTCFNGCAVEALLDKVLFYFA